ncbi:Nodulation-signaling pathway 2 protein [Vitis vinifera]|uniref:Nodulation-signaling pathway 2 protein n=1 Tax=Vitis vinifera TaxID=29760 RepID=A0A438H0K8_VITVI|nr:Nodulation-signaling pathway 2 protein [Vitis vinifera]
MAYEQIPYPLEPSYNEKPLDCSLETVFSFQTEDPICPKTIQDGIFHDQDMERLFQVEDGLLDFNSIHGDHIMGLERAEETKMGYDASQEAPEQVDFLADESSHLNGIQEELMEDCGLADLLLAGAEAVEAQNWPLASSIILKLNDLLLHQAKGTTNLTDWLCFSLKACITEMLQELSPYVKFAHFTANQAILEAAEGGQEVHVIDFDIMEGIQWPPLMVDLAVKKDVSLRITSILSDQENVDIIQQTGRRLKEFAESISLSFTFDQMVILREEDFDRIEVGDTLIANCMIHQLYMPNRSLSFIKTFLGGVSKLSPKIVVLVEEDLFNFCKIPTMSFVEFFCEALHHYAAFSDSLMSSFSGIYKVGLRLIEEEFLRNRIWNSLRQFPCEKKEKSLWEDGFASLKRFKPIPLSSCNVAQAKFLVGLFSGEYWFAELPIYIEKSDVELKTMDPPFTIGEYTVRSKVGQGPQSTVWKAEQKCSGEVVALKQVYLSKLNRNLKTSLDCEINFLSSVSHPNIIRLLHVFQVRKGFSSSFALCANPCHNLCSFKGGPCHILAWLASFQPVHSLSERYLKFQESCHPSLTGKATRLFTSLLFPQQLSLIAMSSNTKIAPLCKHLDPGLLMLTTACLDVLWTFSYLELVDHAQTHCCSPCMLFTAKLQAFLIATSIS